MRRVVHLVGLSFLLAACASGPRFDTGNVNRALSPAQASTALPAAGTRVLWGGVVLASSNLKDSTQIEVLAYPLSDSQRPETDRAPEGRFLVVEPGYVETADYQPGRRITVIGPVAGSRQGRIGESDYTYPVVDADKIHVWPRGDTGRSSEPSVHFGVGVIFH